MQQQQQQQQQQERHREARLLHRRRDDSGWSTLARRLIFIACAAYSMYVTGTFNEISSAVSSMTLDQRLLMSLVLGAFCALVQAVIFPPSRYSTGVAQLLPSIVLVSLVNEVFFKSESWPFSTPFASLHSILSVFQATPLRFLSLFYSAVTVGFVLPFFPRLCQVYIFFAVQAVVYVLMAVWVSGMAPNGLRAFVLDLFSLDAADHLISPPTSPSYSTSSNPLVSLLRSAIAHSTLSLSRVGELIHPTPADESLISTIVSVVLSGSTMLFALWLLKRKNILLLSLANTVRYTDTCFICALAMGLMFTRAVAAVASVGSHLQPVSFLSFHIGSLYLAAHLSVIEVAAVVELILFPMFMAFRITLQPLPPPSPVNSAPSPSTPRAADAAAKQQ